MRITEAVVALAVAAPFALGLTAAAQAEDEPEPWFHFEDPAIVESSGVALAFGMVVTVNDSGDEARLFVVDPDTGRTVGVTRWDGEAEDIEALAPAGSGGVWVGDIGDNASERETITVTRVSVGPGEDTVVGESYELAYPAGPADAEALLVDPMTRRLVVVTKTPFGGRFFQAPRRLDSDEVNMLRPRGRGMRLVTGGEFFPDGKHLVLRNYGRAQVYSWPSLAPVGRSFDLPGQEQGESMAVRADGTLVITSEGTRSPVLTVPVPAEIATEIGLAPGEVEPTPEEPGPAPSSGATEQEPSDAGVFDREATWWLIGAGVLVVIVLVLVRSPRVR